MRGWGIQLGPYVFVEWHNFVILPLNNITVDFLKIHKSQFSVQFQVCSAKSQHQSPQSKVQTFSFNSRFLKQASNVLFKN